VKQAVLPAQTYCIYSRQEKKVSFIGDLPIFLLFYMDV